MGIGVWGEKGVEAKGRTREREGMKKKNVGVKINLHVCNNRIKINACYLRLMGF